MILKAYSVFDKAVGAFLTPFFCRSHGEAKRRFIASASGSQDFAANVRDYELYYVSEWDDTIGGFGVPEDQRLQVPLRLMSGLEAVAAATRGVANENAPPRIMPVGNGVGSGDAIDPNSGSH